jgi:hypothetical protein
MRVASSLGVEHQEACENAGLFFYGSTICGHEGASGQTLAHCLSHCSSTDSAGRVGGEEFALVLPETPPASALLAGERLRMASTELNAWISSDKLRVTVSVGAALRALSLPRREGDGTR